MPRGRDERARRRPAFRDRPQDGVEDPGAFGTTGIPTRGVTVRARSWIRTSAFIDEILEDDKGQLKKQRHTAKRIYERLRDEHGFAGGITIVTDYVREKKRRSREVFVPLAHPAGHAQVDFGEAVGVIGGVRRKLH